MEASMAMPRFTRVILQLLVHLIMVHTTLCLASTSQGVPIGTPFMKHKFCHGKMLNPTDRWGLTYAACVMKCIETKGCR